jgi:hypothetical protein
MAIQCNNATQVGSAVVAQHLFLGASVVSFNTNIGWGGNDSKLNVELINDFANNGCIKSDGSFVPMFPNLNGDTADDHYYSCTSNNCYIDENGNPYDPARTWDPDRPAIGLPPSKRRVVPGKVYHRTDNNGLVSQYWKKPDPGFFGVETLISPLGAYSDNVNGPKYKYNLINAPVYFRFGYFTFGGFITNWTCNNRLSTPTYSVTISSADKLLEDCKVIVSKFGGSVFCSLNGTVDGGPTNYAGTLGTYNRKLLSGNLANVFNVYGFLESYGYGTSNSNDNGIPLAYALEALAVLTSAEDNQAGTVFTSIFPNIQPNPTINRLGYQSAFSPWGRILSPTVLGGAFTGSGATAVPPPLDDPTYAGLKEAAFNNYGFGIIPSVARVGRQRVEFLLDLSEIPRPPLDVRYNGSGQDGICSIKDLITEACRKTGCDFYTTIVRKNGLNYIKVKTISRKYRIPNNSVENIVKTLETSNIDITRSEYGQTKNDQAQSRVMYIGANQQRLFQAKSYLLGYSNTHLIYHPILKKFVNYHRFGGQESSTSYGRLPTIRTRTSTTTSGNGWVDSVRVPMAYSTRNIVLSNTLNGPVVTLLFGNEQQLASGANATDNGFSDSPVGGSVTLYTGNYWYANTYKMLGSFPLLGTTPCSNAAVGTGLTSGPRFIPLNPYTISPFFGYANDQYIPIEATKGSNLYRFVRPVYLDTWTGLITIVFRSNECPILSMGTLPPLYEAKFSDVNTDVAANANNEGIASANTVGGAPGVAQPDVTKKIGNGVPSDTAKDPFNYTSYARNNKVGFTITETELRAACAGLDSYLAYCLQKLPWHKPDLFTMLVSTYASKGKLFVSALASLPAANGVPVDGVGSGGTVGGVANNNTAGPLPGIPRAMGQGGAALNYNFNWVLNHEFMKDLDIIVRFITNLHDTYYGKKYLVKLPEVLSYRDKQYSDIRIRAGTDFITVYQGDGKIFFNYEITNDGAWEELENYIDDCIVIGGADYYKLCEPNGLIKPLIGYNATPVPDYVSRKWCQLSAPIRMQRLDAEISNISRVLDSAATNNTISDGSPITQPELETAKKRYKQLLVTKKLGLIMRDCQNLLVPSLDIGSLDGDYIIVETGDKNRKDPYDESLGSIVNASGFRSNVKNPPATTPAPSTPTAPQRTVTSSRTSTPITISANDVKTCKLFAKTSCEDNFVFLDPINLLGPRAIINAPGINLYNSSMSYVTDPNNSIITNASVEDYAILNAIGRQSGSSKRAEKALTKFLLAISANMRVYGTNESVSNSMDCKKLFNNLSSILLSNVVSLTDSGYLIPDRRPNRTRLHMPICPRKANPMFAAIPLKNNVACYGPWTNYPYLITDDRLLGPKFATANITYKELIVENLINNIDIRQDPTWAPWNFGGMSFLDREIINQIDTNATYQGVIEDGTITTYGLPLFSMSCGLQIRQTDSQTHYVYPSSFMGWKYSTITGIQWTAYAGLALSNIGVSVSDREIITTYKFQTYNQKLGIYSKEISERNKLMTTNRIGLNAEIGKIKRELTQKIISEVDSITKRNRENREGTDGSKLKSAIYGTSPTTMLVGSTEYYSPSYIHQNSDSGIASVAYASLLPNGANLSLAKFLHNNIRTKTFVGNFVVPEALTELSNQYESKSVMSLDGIFSPVSFYPSYNFGTYPISSRCKKDPNDQNTICPACDNSGIIKYYAANGNTVYNTFNNVDMACPLCSKSRVVFPSGDPNAKEDDPPDINLISLHPIVMPYGDFRNPNSQISNTGLERSRHSISIVGRQEFPPVGYQGLETHDNLTYSVSSGGISTTEYAMNGTQTSSNVFNPDYYEYDLSYGRNDGKRILANSRFFAFRGPMMLHGWGYDTEGYPVPNKADEPRELDSLGRPKRFILTSSGTNDLKKDPKFLPGAGELLGDVIGKGYVKENGEWTRKPTRFFHLNWAERSDLWPVGPIDLRWDAERKVWTAAGECGELYPPYIVSSTNDITNLANFLRKKKKAKKCPYKLIYITLEEDMTLIDGFNETFPARGFIDDVEYSSEMLPLNTRRLVYIKDRSSYTAPRGAKLLCKYDKDTGFYEPISKQSFIVFGTMSGGNNAVVDLSYIQGLKSGENAQRIPIVFDNTRFNFTLSGGNSKGMFLYENGKWILIGSN